VNYCPHVHIFTLMQILQIESHTPSCPTLRAGSASTNISILSAGRAARAGASVLASVSIVVPAVRVVEQGFGTGAQVGAFYDLMIAKLVVHGADRTEALRVLRVALEEYGDINPITSCK
jgi:hypothetical protein